MAIGKNSEGNDNTNLDDQRDAVVLENIKH
jgi:hypothetical protein